MADLSRTAVASVMVTTLVGAAILGAAAAPAAARTMTPEDVAHLREVGGAVISPDGSAVAYLLQVRRIPFRDEDGSAWRELWLVEGDGEPRPYVTGEVRIGDVAWTPDGHSISFLAERGEDEEDALYLIPRSGGEARRVLGHETGIEAYSWNGDGSMVAYLAEDEKPEGVEELEEAGFDAVVFEEDAQRTQLWVAAVGGDDDEAAEVRKLPLDGEVRSVAWCPGGDRLAVTLSPESTVDSGYMESRIKVVDPTSGEVVAAIANPGKLGDVTWSPDCSHLAFISGVDVNDPQEGRLMVASVADGAFRDIVPGYLGHVLDVAWADGSTLVFLGDEGVESLIYRVGRDGGDRTTLLGAGETVWGSIDVAGAAGAVALTGESAQHPPELFTASLGDAVQPVRRTDSNPWLSKIDLGAQEVVTYKARDGLELQGILIRPVDGIGGTGGTGGTGDGSGTFPLIVKVHGGPEAHYRDGWLTSYSSPGQVGAGAGYAVFYPNYRGSTGRGVEFSVLSQGRPAKEEFDDLVDGVDHLIATGLVDGERVGITGGSYGGYASAWAATYYTERFAASVMFVGISDKVSKLGTSDIPEELYLVHERKRLWDDWQHFLEASPIYYVEKARTPILILGGDADTRVDPGQSLELFRHLKTLGKTPVRLIRYPGEPHGNRRAASQYDYHLRMMRWFDHYLKGPGGEPPPPRLEYPLQEMVGE